ncbi:hypothetical protein BaRGS_00017211, partial [Batillaria attramentaria]
VISWTSTSTSPAIRQVSDSQTPAIVTVISQHLVSEISRSPQGREPKKELKTVWSRGKNWSIKDSEEGLLTFVG